MPRYAPDIALPPYSYIPGHDLPHPVNDPRGHSFGHASQPTPVAPDVLSQLPTNPASRRRTLAVPFTASSGWLYAVDLFNEGFYWESHEAWELFWNSLGRTTPGARFVQGLILLAAASVKIREGKPAGVARHAQRARALLIPSLAADEGTFGTHVGFALDPESIRTVLAELDAYSPECWHTSRFPVVKVLTAGLRVAG